MGDDRRQQRTEADAEIEREIRQGRKFTAREAMAHMAGPGAMKGASPISPVQQAETEIGNWLRINLTGGGKALQVVLLRHLKGSELLLSNLDQPLTALAGLCQRVLASGPALKELVREAEVEWGRAMDERPFFEQEGSLPDPGDPYTAETVRRSLEGVLRQLSGAIP